VTIARISKLTIDDVLAAPIAESHVLLISGTGLSRGAKSQRHDLCRGARPGLWRQGRPRSSLRLLYPHPSIKAGLNGWSPQRRMRVVPLIGTKIKIEDDLGARGPGALRGKDRGAATWLPAQPVPDIKST